MPRAIWSGAISFGLVNVPVKLYSAVSRKTVRFNQLHATDHVRIQQKRWCPGEDAEVPYEEIVKGYEIAPDQYVVIEPEELESLEAEKTRTIEIEDFVDLSEIDPIFYDHPYYLAPGQGAGKAYGLLVKAMRDANKVGIARFVLRSKESLAALRATDDGVLTISTMLFADEVVDPDAIDEVGAAADAKAGKREVEMAKQLIESLTGPFDPGKYHDTYRERVLDLIERKAQGEDITLQPAPEPPAKVPDLMAALEASLKAVKDGSGSSDGDGDEKPARKPRSRADSSNGKSKPSANGKSKSSGRSKSSSGGRKKAKA